MKGSNVHQYISCMNVNIKQKICRDYIAPGVYLSYKKQLTTDDKFFGKICKFLILVYKTLVQKRLCCSKSKKEQLLKDNLQMLRKVTYLNNCIVRLKPLYCFKFYRCTLTSSSHRR